VEDVDEADKPELEFSLATSKILEFNRVRKKDTKDRLKYDRKFMKYIQNSITNSNAESGSEDS
jgi:hypothetical protein